MEMIRSRKHRFERELHGTKSQKASITGDMGSYPIRGMDASVLVLCV
jgi:hypothetical protein